MCVGVVYSGVFASLCVCINNTQPYMATPSPPPHPPPPPPLMPQKSSAPHRCLVDEVGVFEMDKVNHWLKGKHKRVLLMFNDLVVVTKKNKEQYMFKQSFSLLNATAVSFQTSRELHCIQWPVLTAIGPSVNCNRAQC